MGVVAWFLLFIVSFSFGVWLLTDQPTLLPNLMTQAVAVILPFLALFGFLSEITDEFDDPKMDDAPTRFLKAKFRKITRRKPRQSRR